VCYYIHAGDVARPTTNDMYVTDPASLTCSCYSSAIQETLRQTLETIEATIYKGKPIERANTLLHEAVDLIRVLDYPKATTISDNLLIVIGLVNASEHLILDDRDEILTLATRWINTLSEQHNEYEDVLDTQMCPRDNPLRHSRTSGLQPGTDSITIDRNEAERIRLEKRVLDSVRGSK